MMRQHVITHTIVTHKIRVLSKVKKTCIPLIYLKPLKQKS